MPIPHDTDYTGSNTNPMHIVPTDEYEAHATGKTTEMFGLCGVDLSTPSDGADEGAPLCPECFAESGWTHDKRTPNPDGHVRDLVAILSEG